jgi:hypothetical protein
VDQVDAEDTQRLLLARGRRVAQVTMENNLGRFLVRSSLEPDAEPAAPGTGVTVAACRYGVGEGEESLGVAAHPFQTIA